MLLERSQREVRKAAAELRSWGQGFSEQKRIMWTRTSVIRASARVRRARHSPQGQKLREYQKMQ